MIGISNKRILPYYSQKNSYNLPPNTYYKVKELYTIRYSDPIGFSCHTEICKLLHNSFVPFNFPENKRDAILLINRHDRPTRSIDNFNDLYSTLTQKFSQESKKKIMLI